MGTDKIREHMEVVGSDGKQVGFVDRVEGESIKLTRDSPGADGEHRFVPLAWVARVDDHVHLGKMADDVREQWQGHAAGPDELVSADPGPFSPGG
jgi:hypothetical protein